VVKKLCAHASVLCCEEMDGECIMFETVAKLAALFGVLM
jgi:hypothetical protein